MKQASKKKRNTHTSKIILLTILILISCSYSAFAEKVQIKVNAAESGKEIDHVWNYWGFDECNFAHTPGGKNLMDSLAKMTNKSAYLRYHFLLNTGDGKPQLKWGSTNVYTEDENGNPVYEWKIMDKVMDAVVNSNCIPLVEIGFMPKALTTSTRKYQHEYPPEQWAGWAYPPNDHEKWSKLIEEWAKHSKERYGSVIENKWLWQLWNEPDIFYWQGTYDDFCKLFDYTEKAFHKVLPNAVYGGPHVTSPAYTGPARWLRRFLEHCSEGTNYATGQKGTRLDYIGFHSKGNTRMVNGHPRVDLGANLRSNQVGFGIVADFEQYKNTPIIIGECDPEGLAAKSSTVEPANGYRNGSHYAAYEVAMMKHTIDLAEKEQVNLRGVLTWAFMFEGKKYFEGFRTLSTNDIHKPVLNGFKLLSKLEGKRIPVESTGALGAETIIREKVRNEPDIDGLATVSDNKVQVVLWNYHDDITDADSSPVTVEIQLPSKDITKAKLTHYLVDKNHSNAYTKWLAMDSPQQPTPEQVTQLKKAAQLETVEKEKTVDVKDGKITLDFDLTRHAVALLEITF